MVPAQKGYPAADRETRVGWFCIGLAKDAAGSPERVMLRRLHLAFFIALIATGSVSARGAAPGSVAGVVRDSAGVPQIGAVVQLLRPDLSVITVVYTNSKGRFSISSIQSGRYAVKAMGTSFLPSLRENVRVRRGTIVNLTLNTLYEVMQWLPAEPRAANAPKDDWAWTLRSAANRPLLRWLEDGPLVVVSDGSGARPRLKARLLATGQEGTFGESGERITASLEETPSDSRELLASVDFTPGTDGEMESMLGFRQDLGFAGSVQSLAAVAIHPEMDGPGSGGLQEAGMRSWETINLGDELEAEVGSEQVVAQFGANSPNVAVESLPFASVGWRNGDSTIRYRMTTFMSGAQDDTGSAAWLPAISATRNGNLVFEHGLHQEIGWERQTDASGMTFVVFADQVENPVLEAATSFSGGQAPAIAGSALFDGVSGLLRAAGPDFSTSGMMASVERRLPSGNRVRLSYANGDALVMPALLHPVPFAQILAAAHPRRTQTYALALSGTLEGTGTKWRASYRWQPEDTITQVAPFAANAVEPYLSLHLRQPVRLRSDGAGGIDALLNVGNLLAQGYRPMVLSDGSLLIFAQNQRSIGAGVAFTF